MPRGKHPRKPKVRETFELEPHPCGVFMANDLTMACALKSDHDGDHEWVKDRHHREEPAPRTMDEAIEMDRKRFAPACARCVAFEPTDDRDAYARVTGLCRWAPPFARVHAEDYCMQWKAKP